jgi:Pilus formation protein N terminal region
MATQHPIIIEPPSVGLAPGIARTVRVGSVLGTITLSGANPTIADISVDQIARTITITGKQVGTTTLTVRDSRGLTRDLPINVAYPAGNIADTIVIRITGNPATPYFVKEQALQAAIQATQLQPGSQIIATQESVNVFQPLEADNVTTVDVPLILQGNGYLTVQGTTHVRVENIALPPIHPAYLMVSDFPETLKQNGLLFEADLSPAQAARFLYYHDNPAGQPNRRIVLKLQNTSSEPAHTQFISGIAGPADNEMLVGHLSTQMFLVHNAGNEGSVLTIPGKTTVTIVNQPLPANNVVSNLIQLREINGAPLHLTLLAHDASASSDDDASQTDTLLSGAVRHARGIYPIPEFFFDYQYDTSGPNIEVPIGQIPIPELRAGEALAGDYGVLQTVTVRIVNPDPHAAAYIALYANPRGGRATGTFIIDGVLVQTHGLAPYSHVKLREYTIPPGGFIRTTVVTMPEGGSSYPLHLVVAPDDGSTSPGAPNSLVY